MRKARGYSASTACFQPRNYWVLIAEKPKAAKMMIQALSVLGTSTIRCRMYDIPYWIIYRRDQPPLVIVPSAGHLFGLHTTQRGFPVYQYEWKPLWDIEKKSKHLKKFYEVLKRLLLNAVLYVNACDYDIEGSVIGYLIIKYFGDESRAKRMKFSSLTRDELLAAFRNLSPLDRHMIEAGLCRHELDWLWGINVSRALMHALSNATGRRVILSAGRVQSPTLLEIMRRDISRRLFIPIPSYIISIRIAVGNKIYTLESLTNIRSLAEAEHKARMLRAEGSLLVDKSIISTTELKPPPPFNLGDLQQEAYKLYRYSPMKTQKLAEDLYLDALISYPRTNSQKLPPTLNINSIVKKLYTSREYKELVEKLYSLTSGRLVPRQGRKEDPAHPAIHPTGNLPSRSLDKDHSRIHDLIVRRFLACMAPPARIQTILITFTSRTGLRYRLHGRRILKKNWLELYPFIDIGERDAPLLRKGDIVRIVDVRVKRVFSQPPQPYTKASIVRWMESVGIGTESTRARIVETLFSRKYLEQRGAYISITELGMEIAEVLQEYFKLITSVELTRLFEKHMEDIRRGTRSRREVVEEAREILDKALAEYRKHYLEAGIRLAKSIGLVPVKNKCMVCDRERLDNNKLCKWHAKALEELLSKYREWKSREQLDFNEYIKRLSKLRSVGILIRDILPHANTILAPE